MEKQSIKDPYESYRIKDRFQKERVPEPIFEELPELVEFYYEAWTSAWRHVVHREDMPESRYMDEAMTPHTIWIWDTCFMTLFCKYAFDYFPGIESLNNFYFIIHDRKKSGARIHFADNPPLFAWVELEYLKLTGALERIKWVLLEKQYLQKHFEFMELQKPWRKPSNVLVSKVSRKYELGYKWSGNTSGMDNTPRGRTWWNNTKLNARGQISHNNIYWLDLLAQQALAANSIAKLAKYLNNRELTEEYSQKFEEKKNLLNMFYWNEKDGFYYDLYRKSSKKINEMSKRNKEIHNKVPTIASYWPLLAETSSKAQAEMMTMKATDPNWFGGDIPYPSLARLDYEYRPTGRYWRGGVWLPTVYMATKAIEKYNNYQIADENAMKIVKMMYKTFVEFEPHTIWEAYSPSEPKPSTQKRDDPGVRPDFCGWSALGPISLFIENILGFHRISAIDNVVEWRIHHKEKHGIKNLKFGKIRTDLIYEKNKIKIQSNAPYILKIINGSGEIIKEISVKEGNQEEEFFFERPL
mgnify:CR=1 FL=1